MGKTKNNVDTVDGRNPANQLRLVVYPSIYKVLYIQTMVVWDFWTINSIFSRFQLVHENWPVFGAAAFCRQVVAIEIGGFSLSTTNQLGATFWMRERNEDNDHFFHNHWTSVENYPKKWKEPILLEIHPFFSTEPWLLGGSSQLVSS